jgi:hypothetical protein
VELVASAAAAADRAVTPPKGVLWIEDGESWASPGVWIFELHTAFTRALRGIAEARQVPCDHGSQSEPIGWDDTKYTKQHFAGTEVNTLPAPAEPSRLASASGISAAVAKRPSIHSRHHKAAKGGAR